MNKIQVANLLQERKELCVEFKKHCDTIGSELKSAEQKNVHLEQKCQNLQQSLEESKQYNVKLLEEKNIIEKLNELLQSKYEAMEEKLELTLLKLKREIETNLNINDSFCKCGRNVGTGELLQSERTMKVKSPKIIKKTWRASDHEWNDPLTPPKKSSVKKSKPSPLPGSTRTKATKIIQNTKLLRQEEGKRYEKMSLMLGKKVRTGGNERTQSNGKNSTMPIQTRVRKGAHRSLTKRQTTQENITLSSSLSKRIKYKASRKSKNNSASPVTPSTPSTLKSPKLIPRSNTQQITTSPLSTDATGSLTPTSSVTEVFTTPITTPTPPTTTSNRKISKEIEDLIEKNAQRAKKIAEKQIAMEIEDKIMRERLNKPLARH